MICRSACNHFLSIERSTSALPAVRRTQTSNESRQLLIAAAAELFAEQGFRKTTVAEVADRAGISRGSIPWHFGNKDGLLEAVIDEFTGTWLNRDPSEVTSLDQVREILRLPTTRLLITLVAEAVEPDSPVHDFYADLHRFMRKSLAHLTRDTKLPPKISHDEFTATLHGAIIGVHQQWRVSPEDIDLDRLFEAMKAIFGQR